jgi:putative phosphotransacetylase
MDDINKIVMDVLEEIKRLGIILEDEAQIPVGISNRHIHLSSKDMEALFGRDTKLTSIKDLSQPGQFACKEMVLLIGPKGHIDNVRILGPTREKTQVEILAQDCFKLGISAPVRISGMLNNTPGITICGPKGCIQLDEGVIIAKRHIHMTPNDAHTFGCTDNDLVKAVCNGERGGILENVVIRVSEMSKLDFHIDNEEANCMGLKNEDKVQILK